MSNQQQNNQHHVNPAGHQQQQLLGQQNGRSIPPIRVQSETPAPPSNTTTPLPGLNSVRNSNDGSNTVQLPKLPTISMLVNSNKSEQKSYSTSSLQQEVKREIQDHTLGYGNILDGRKDVSGFGPQAYGITPQPPNTAQGMHHTMSNSNISRIGGTLPLQNRTNLPLQQNGGMQRSSAMPSLSINNASPTPSDISSIQYSSHNQSITPSSQHTFTAPTTTCTDKQFLGPHSTMTIKQEWQKYQVLPQLTTPHGCNELGDQNFPPPGSALSQYPSSSTSLSPFPVDFISPSGSSFASPRGSARSHSARSKKRALSLSPLSTEGFNINDIIRTSPTSLVSFINGSRGSSCSVSPAPGLQPGDYGHLSVRNSPQSQGSFGHSGYQSGMHSRQSSVSLPPPYHAPKHSQLYSMPVENNLDYEQQHPQQNMGNLQVQSQLIVQPYNEIKQDFVNLNIYKHDAMDTYQSSTPSIPTSMPTTTMPNQNMPNISMPPPPSYQQHMETTQVPMGTAASMPPPPPPPPLQLPLNRITIKTETGENGEKLIHLCKWIDCNAIFNEQEELVRHIEKVHIDQRKGDDFTCFWQGCSRKYKPFNARYKLLIHMRVHSGEKPNKCTFEGCNKAFSRLENLKIHLRSHTGERPYLCQYSGCNKAFSNSSDRAKHQRTHLDTKPYACQIPGCTKRYTDPSSLRKHVKAHTAKEQQARKKFRTSGEYSPHQDMLNECLTIQPLQPLPPPSDNHSSPMDLSDSGLGRSPHSSMAGTSSDMYPGMFSSAHSSRSSTATAASNYSNHASPVHSMTGSPHNQVQSMTMVEERSGNYGPTAHHVSPTRRSYPPSLLSRRQPQQPLSVVMKLRPPPAPSAPPPPQTSLPETSIHVNGLIMNQQSNQAIYVEAGIHSNNNNHQRQTSCPSLEVINNRHLMQTIHNQMSNNQPGPHNFANIPTFEETLSPTVPYDVEKIERVFSAKSLTIERALSAHSLHERIDLTSTPSDFGVSGFDSELLQMSAVDRCPSQLSAVYAD
uniref:Zinc finger protein GLIS3-like n=1 Tax=Saccoglossus kowalevskii TaxID=10224 RepID=A0ABM0N0F9_SACKO|nr:PREDICTED: zinc finger protein GLIS3-like [Saccoglossus kowalevskii]